MLLPDDPARAFMPYPAVEVANAPSGPLAGLTLGVKDLYDVAGYPTSGGSPHVLALSGVKTRSAAVVERLARCRRPLRRQDDHRRARLLAQRQERPFRHAGERRRAGPHPGRLVLGLGRRGVEPALRHRARQRHRRLGARAGEPLRPVRHPPEPRPHQPRGLPRARAVVRHLRLLRPRRRHLREGERRAARRRPGALAGDAAPAARRRCLRHGRRRGPGRARAGRQGDRGRCSGKPVSSRPRRRASSRCTGRTGACRRARPGAASAR